MNVELSNWLLAQAADPWFSTFFDFDDGKRFALLIVMIGCGTGIIISAVGMITGLVNSLHRRRTEADMKQDLLDRGLSADEIARIIESSAPEDAIGRWVASWGKKNSG
jgi:hypothetical protein